MINHLSYIKKIFYSCASLTPDVVLHLYAPKLILPAYHLVSDEIPDHIRYLYKSKSKKEFIKDLDFLLKHYTPIELQDLIQLSRSGLPVKKNAFHISFDDGLRECHDIIAPILKEKGIPATFFINTSFIGNKDLMYRYKASLLVQKILSKEGKNYKAMISLILNTNYNNRESLDEFSKTLDLNFEKYLDQKKPYMDFHEIQNLVKDGFTIGAHSLDHPQYSQIPLEHQMKQTKESITYIANTFKLNYRVFAFPFTDYGVSRSFFDSIFNPSDSIADLTFGVAGMKKDYHIKNLQRIPMENGYSGESAIKGEYLYYSAKALVGKNKIRRDLTI